MAQQNYELAEHDYMDGMKYKDIAEKYGVTINTVKSWKKRYSWDRKGCTQTKRGAHKKKGGQPGNKNATGPPGNKNAEKHGFFSKWLPEETAEIMKAIEKTEPLDLLWDNIQLQYTAIIRAQKLMYVKDQKDKTIEKVGESFGKVESEKWEVQEAWDKHATFLNAQSRAMKTLESMMKQYDELLHRNWDLATDEQKARIDNIKAATAKIKGDGEETTEDDGFINALKGEAAEIWQE